MVCGSAAIQRTNVSRTNVRNMTFKVESRENDYIGIDLKKVSLKRKIKNDDSTTEVRPKPRDPRTGWRGLTKSNVI